MSVECLFQLWIFDKPFVQYRVSFCWGGGVFLNRKQRKTGSSSATADWRKQSTVKEFFVGLLVCSCKHFILLFWKVKHTRTKIPERVPSQNERWFEFSFPGHVGTFEVTKIILKRYIEKDHLYICLFVFGSLCLGCCVQVTVFRSLAFLFLNSPRALWSYFCWSNSIFVLVHKQNWIVDQCFWSKFLGIVRTSTWRPICEWSLKDPLLWELRRVEQRGRFVLWPQATNSLSEPKHSGTAQRVFIHAGESSTQSHGHLIVKQSLSASSPKREWTCWMNSCGWGMFSVQTVQTIRPYFFRRIFAAPKQKHFCKLTLFQGKKAGVCTVAHDSCNTDTERGDTCALWEVMHWTCSEPAYAQ